MTKARSQAKIGLFGALLVFVLFSAQLWASCHNGCPCSPSDLPNSCDVAGWCIDRNSIKKIELKTVTDKSSQKRLYLKFSITYLPAECEGQPNVRPYDMERVELYVTAKTNPGNLGSYNKSDPTKSDLHLEDILAGPIVATEVKEESKPGTLVLETPDEGILVSSIRPVPAGKKKYLDVVLWHPTDDKRPTGRQEFEVPGPKGKFVLELGPHTKQYLKIDSRMVNFVQGEKKEEALPKGEYLRKYKFSYIANWDPKLGTWDIYNGTDTRILINPPPKGTPDWIDWYWSSGKRVKMEVEVSAGATVDFGMELGDDPYYVHGEGFRRLGNRGVGWTLYDGAREITASAEINEIIIDTFRLTDHPAYGYYDYWPVEYGGITELDNHSCPFPPCEKTAYPGYLFRDNLKWWYVLTDYGGPPHPPVPRLMLGGPINPVNGDPVMVDFGRRMTMPSHNLRIQANLASKHLLTLNKKSAINWATSNPYSATPLPGVPKQVSDEIGTCNGSGDIILSRTDIDCGRFHAGDRIEISTVPDPSVIVDHWDIPGASFFEPQTDWEKLCSAWVDMEMPGSDTSVSFTTRDKFQAIVQGGYILPRSPRDPLDPIRVAGDNFPLPLDAKPTDFPLPACNLFGEKSEGYFLGEQLLLFGSSAPFPAGQRQAWQAITWGDDGGWHSDPPTTYRRVNGSYPWGGKFNVDYIEMPDSDTTFCHPWELRDSWGWGDVVYRLSCGGSKIPDPSGAAVASMAFSVKTAEAVKSFSAQNSVAVVGVSIVFEGETVPSGSVNIQALPCARMDIVVGKDFDQILNQASGYQIQFTQEAENPVLYYLNEPDKWEKVAGQSFSENRLSACVSDPGFYQVFDSHKEASRPGTAPDLAPSAVNDVFIYPNPVREGGGSILRIEAHDSNFANARIYDVSGDLVHEESLPEPYSEPGKTQVYEIDLPVQRLRSGSYLGIVTVGKSGSGLIRKKFSFAVIK